MSSALVVDITALLAWGAGQAGRGHPKVGGPGR